MEIKDKWIGNCRLTVIPWIDGKTLYCNIEYFKSGSSIHHPEWENTIYITDDRNGRNFVFNYTNTLVDYIIANRVADGQKMIVTVGETPLSVYDKI